MKLPPATEKRVAKILEDMNKAMPEIRRQVAVYEKSLKAGSQNKTPKIAVESRNV